MAELEAQQAAHERARIADERVEPARLLEAPDIEFPRSLRHRKVEGEIALVVSLAPSGDVADVRVDERTCRPDPQISRVVRAGSSPRRPRRRSDPTTRLRIPIQFP